MIHKGPLAIVTGVGGGIGRETTLTFAKEGANVAVDDYYEDRTKVS